MINRSVIIAALLPDQQSAPNITQLKPTLLLNRNLNFYFLKSNCFIIYSHILSHSKNQTHRNFNTDKIKPNVLGRKEGRKYSRRLHRPVTGSQSELKSKDVIRTIFRKISVLFLFPHSIDHAIWCKFFNFKFEFSRPLVFFAVYKSAVTRGIGEILVDHLQHNAGWPRAIPSLCFKHGDNLRCCHEDMRVFHMKC